MWIIPVLNGFAWSIGGEHYFGRWRRGVLVAIPSLLAGILGHSTLWYYVAVLALFYPVYQMIRYDDAIQWCWPEGSEPNKWYLKVAGWCWLAVNGVLAGLMPFAYFMLKGFYVKAGITGLICAGGFCFICWLSNGLKFKPRLGTIKWGLVQIWGGDDPWWVACFIFGLIRGGCYLLG